MIFAPTEPPLGGTSQICPAPRLHVCLRRCLAVCIAEYIERRCRNRISMNFRLSLLQLSAMPVDVCRGQLLDVYTIWRMRMSAQVDRECVCRKSVIPAEG